MKVILLGPAWPYRGGIAAFNERLARQYQSEGHEVEIVTFTLQYPSFLFPGKTQYSEEPAPEGLKITRKLKEATCRLGDQRFLASFHGTRTGHCLPFCQA